MASAPFLGSIDSLVLIRLALDLLLKSSLLVAGAWCLTLILRGSAAHLRSRIWGFALIGLALLPPLAFVVPSWGLPILPHLSDLTSLFSFGNSSGITGNSITHLLSTDPTQSGAVLDAARDGGLPYTFQWSHGALIVLAGGALLTLLWLGIGRLALRGVIRGAAPLGDSWQPMLEGLSREFGLRRRVRLLASNAVRAGITVGTFRPLIVLPQEADTWTPERRRFTMSHELAHVQRLDALLEDLAFFVLVIFWFNPLVWFAIKRLRIERELDCDNRVLSAGARPSDYAQQLMEIAAGLDSRAKSSWRLAWLSQSSNLRDRLLHILQSDITRGASRRGAVAVVGVLILAATLPLAAANPWRAAIGFERYDQVELAKKSEKYWAGVKEKKRNASATYLAEKILTVTDADEAVATLRNLMMVDVESRRYHILEDEVNALGYRLVNQKRTGDAIAIFKFNVLAFPSAWNVYDSLAEAYMHIGKFELALKNYQHSIKLGSKNSDKAQMAIDQLKKKIYSKSQSSS